VLRSVVLSSIVIESALLSSSLRVSPPERTLAHAERRARELGITRVTDITRLDRVGIPVYASIRPNARPGSLCVNAGKGQRAIEAEVGAYMEAIEYALAEPGASPVEVVKAKARDILDGAERYDAALDLCPRMGTRIRLDEAVTCVTANDVVSGRPALLPAELVFFPYAPAGRERVLFGSDTNGLASGNDVQEGTVHALAELIERDVRSFQGLRDTSLFVDLDSIGDSERELVKAIRDAGFYLFVRTVPNAFGVPYFCATLFDPQAESPYFINAGFGCHPHRSVALVRAVCEAAQSRLSLIHGGRDDLEDWHAVFRNWPSARKRAHIARMVAGAGRGQDRAVRFADLDDWSAECTSVARCEQWLIERLHAVGLTRVLRVTFCLPHDAVQVLRVVVPGLEYFNEKSCRTGKRLADLARAS
jgi:ribosomal protein S12 methylthiotransferase accessory factor